MLFNRVLTLYDRARLHFVSNGLNCIQTSSEIILFTYCTHVEEERLLCNIYGKIDIYLYITAK